MFVWAEWHTASLYLTTAPCSEFFEVTIVKKITLQPVLTFRTIVVSLRSHKKTWALCNWWAFATIVTPHSHLIIICTLYNTESPWRS